MKEKQLRIQVRNPCNSTIIEVDEPHFEANLKKNGWERVDELRREDAQLCTEQSEGECTPECTADSEDRSEEGSSVQERPTKVSQAPRLKNQTTKKKTNGRRK